MAGLWIPLAIGVPLGALWTLVFGPMLDRVRQDRRNWFAYGVEAIGVFLMSAVLEKVGRLTPILLLAAMISAGGGMFLVKVIFHDGDLHS